MTHMKRLTALMLAASGTLFAAQAIAQTSSGSSSGTPSTTSPSTTSPSTTSPSTSTPSMGSGGAADADKTMTDLDANKDGAVDKKEAARNRDLSAHFDKADTNKDGKLDRTELDAALKMSK